jgi:hypothetical protein
MLYVVLGLVIAAFALLVGALTTANTLWAWVSVAISVVAAAILVFDWIRGRRRVATTSSPRVVERPPTEAPPERFTEPPAPAEITAIEGFGEPEPDPEPLAHEAIDSAEPDEEATDAADLLIVADLSVEVRVVDEHPRYHLAQCTWLTGKPTIPIPVSEARQLGFTPCARCGPDAALARKHRAGSNR